MNKQCLLITVAWDEDAPTNREQRYINRLIAAMHNRHIFLSNYFMLASALLGLLNTDEVDGVTLTRDDIQGKTGYAWKFHLSQTGTTIYVTFAPSFFTPSQDDHAAIFEALSRSNMLHTIGLAQPRKEGAQ